MKTLEQQALFDAWCDCGWHGNLLSDPTISSQEPRCPKCAALSHRSADANSIVARWLFAVDKAVPSSSHPKECLTSAFIPVVEAPLTFEFRPHEGMNRMAVRMTGRVRCRNCGHEEEFSTFEAHPGTELAKALAAG